jgi:glycosyltransferase involved in cell wall biosynthesis
MPEFQKVKDAIVFYGRLPVNIAYQNAEKSKVALSILHPVPNYVRSYSTKIFEYMAIGVPFIVSNFKLYEFVKEKGIGFIVDPMNPIEIANQIERILTNEAAVEKVIDAGISEVSSNYSWDSQAKNLLNLYAEIAKSTNV